MKVIEIETQVESDSISVPELSEWKGKRVHVRIEELPVAVKPAFVEPGALKGQIKMSPDFDEPLEEFKEYM